MIQLSADTVWKCFSNVTLQTICSVSSIACIVQNVFLYFPPSPSWLKEKGRGCWWCAILLSPGCGWRTSVCTILPGHQVAWRTRYSIELGLPCLASHQGHCLVDTGDSSIPTNIPILGMCTFSGCAAANLFFIFIIWWQIIKCFLLCANIAGLIAIPAPEVKKIYWH